MDRRPEKEPGSVFQALLRKGVSRRDFMKLCTATAATLGLPVTQAARIAEALEKPQKPSLVWLEFQDCAGDTESFLRASKPTAAEIVLDVLSLDYHETIMAPAGHQAVKSLDDVVTNLKGQYIAVVEGSIPTAEGGIHCCVGGRTALDITREVCGNALATIAVGTCATHGGWPAAEPNPTRAKGVREIMPSATVINIPGCPLNVENLVATVVHFLTFDSLPATDTLDRPLFAFGKRIHDNCERRSHFDAGQFVKEWGDYGHRQGWCLYELGCKGPETYHNCPIVRWNEGTNWPVGSGHGCIGCSEPRFWDAHTPFYRRLPKVPGFGVESTADKIGVGLAAATAAGLVAHGVVRAIKGKPSEKKTEE